MCPGLKVIAPYSGGRRQGPAQGRDPRPEPGRLPRERAALRPELRGARSSTITSCRSARRGSSATGEDVTIVAFSLMVGVALKAAEELAEEGIEAEVIDLRTLRPLDTETIVASVKKTNRIVSVEEGWPSAGIGSEIAATDDGAGVRLARRAGAAGHRQGRAAALCRQPRAAGGAAGRRHRAPRPRSRAAIAS